MNSKPLQLLYLLRTQQPVVPLHALVGVLEHPCSLWGFWLSGIARGSRFTLPDLDPELATSPVILGMPSGPGSEKPLCLLKIKGSSILSLLVLHQLSLPNPRSLERGSHRRRLLTLVFG